MVIIVDKIHHHAASDRKTGDATTIPDLMRAMEIMLERCRYNQPIPEEFHHAPRD